MRKVLIPRANGENGMTKLGIIIMAEGCGVKRFIGMKLLTGARNIVGIAIGIAGVVMAERAAFCAKRANIFFLVVGEKNDWSCIYTHARG